MIKAQEFYRTNYIINEMGFKNIFERVFSSAHIGYKKPQKEFFEHIMQKLATVQKENILFWDDTLGHVNAARKFGWHAELYVSFEDFKKKMGKYLSVKSFERE